MTTINELSAFIEREKTSAAAHPQAAGGPVLERSAEATALEASELPSLAGTKVPDAEPQPAQWPTR